MPLKRCTQPLPRRGRFKVPVGLPIKDNSRARPGTAGGETLATAGNGQEKGVRNGWGRNETGCFEEATRGKVELIPSPAPSYALLNPKSRNTQSLPVRLLKSQSPWHVCIPRVSGCGRQVRSPFSSAKRCSVASVGPTSSPSRRRATHTGCKPVLQEVLGRIHSPSPMSLSMPMARHTENFWTRSWQTRTSRASGRRR